ncbi:hypothetical protein BDQ17DRAFT_1340924 [Cyathus striatus]|nr:hypothetical protein BDQ17DRAFT_1340924 [Cyathus striatus]
MISRHPSTSASSHRTPRKRQAATTSQFIYSFEHSFQHSSHGHSPPPATRTPKSKIHSSHPSRSSPVHAAAIDLTSSAEVSPNQAEAYSFPTLDTSNDFISPVTDPPSHHSYSRTRSRTGPSARSDWDGLATVSHFRVSGSSSTQHTETPPRTPTDYSGSADSFEHFPVVVAAPVSGVEMMDALVDGMNGGSIFSDPLSRSMRSRFDIRGHHPLYQPPLPTPPPGVILGGGKPRRPKTTRPLSSSESGEDEDTSRNPSASRPRRRKPRSAGRSASTSTITAISSTSLTPTKEKELYAPSSYTASPSISSERRKSVVPSISDIIKAHARPHTSTACTHDLSQQDVHPPSIAAGEEDLDLISRSSIDSVADEVQKTLRNQGVMHRAPHSVASDSASIRSPRSDPGRAPYHPNSPHDATFFSLVAPSPSQEVARYLRSARLTTLLKLTRFSDLGSSTGYPVLVFLGLGCMAECMNLRLITIDRWGLGRTDSRSKSERGIRQWAYVVEEILDLLHIDCCSIMAHSAGAPYALAFANKIPSRIKGEIYLLAPWVGGSDSSGYKWLKYVPNGILKTAQAAEWKLQAWMIGKPPSVSYQGIGYIAPSSKERSIPHSTDSLSMVYPSNAEGRPRPSMGSSTFSDTLGTGARSPPAISRSGSESKIFVSKRKSTRSFLERLKGSSTSPEPVPDGKITSRGLKALKSMGSLKGKTRASKGSEPSSPQFPLLEVGAGFDHLSWPKPLDSDSHSNQTSPGTPRSRNPGENTRSSGRRSISFTSSNITTSSMPSSPSPSSTNSGFGTEIGTRGGYQALLGNSLIAASHAESAKGMHSDLLQILNHENHSWGFSYASYPHKVRVWYGDKDEKIAENAVRWMEKTMGSDQCSVKVVKGADHSLMYRSTVVVEILEEIGRVWESPTH